MPIDINSLFADIIDTPEQRQQKLLQQGMAQGQLLSSGLRGRAAALAPLAQVAGQLGVQRQEDLRRAVQPMIGIDPRTTGEKMAEQLGSLDPSDPDSLLKAAQTIQSIDPVRAATLRQAALERGQQIQEFELAQRQKEQQIAESEQSIISSQENILLNRRRTDIELERLGFQVEDREYQRRQDEIKNEQWQKAFDLEQEQINQNRSSLSVAGQKAQAEFLSSWQDSRAKARRASALADKFSAYNETGTGGRSGAVGRASRALTTLLGSEDPSLLSYAELEEIRASNAIQLLPKGPASDRDINLVLNTQLSDLNSKADIESYLRGIAKAQAIIAEDSRQTLEYIGKNNGEYSGYISEWEKMQRGEDSSLYEFSEGETFADYMNSKYQVDIGYNTAITDDADEDKDALLDDILGSG